MAIVEGKSQLAGVKAVGEGYPLRGQLRTAPALGAPDAPAPPGPPRGKVWIEERLVSALGAPVGTRVSLGQAQLQVAAVLTALVRSVGTMRAEGEPKPIFSTFLRGFSGLPVSFGAGRSAGEGTR